MIFAKFYLGALIGIATALVMYDIGKAQIRKQAIKVKKSLKHKKQGSN